MTEARPAAFGPPVTVDRRAFAILDRIRTSFWFVPGLLAVGAIAVSQLARLADETLTFDGGLLDRVLYVGAPDDAHSLLSSLAGSIVTVTGVVFSITIVTLSFASSHLGPRLLRDFMRDRRTQTLLGFMIAVFLYEILVLASIQSHGEVSVHRLSISLGLLAATAALGALVLFLHHVASSIRIDHVIASVRRGLDETIDRLYPEDHADARAEDDERPEMPAAARPVPAPASGYLEAIDYSHLAEMARQLGGGIVCRIRPAAFVTEGDELADVDGEPDDEQLQELASCFVTGPQRTEVQDVEYAVRQLVEVALRALSPGVNDPYTAVSCIDHLGAALSRLAGRRTPAWSRWREDGALLVAAPTATFEGAMDTAWNQLRQHGASNQAIALRLLEALASIAARARDTGHAGNVRHHADAILEGALATRPAPCDEQALRQRHEAVGTRLGDT